MTEVTSIHAPKIMKKVIVIGGGAAGMLAATAAAEAGARVTLLEKNEKLLRDYFVRVIDRFGAGNVSELLRLMKQLEEIMETEFSNGG